MDDNHNNTRQRCDNDNQFDDMYAYLSGIPVAHDDVPQHIFSCIANGKYDNQSDVAVLAAVPKGVDTKRDSARNV